MRTPFCLTKTPQVWFPSLPKMTPHYTESSLANRRDWKVPGNQALQLTPFLRQFERLPAYPPVRFHCRQAPLRGVVAQSAMLAGGKALLWFLSFAAISTSSCTRGALCSAVQLTCKSHEPFLSWLSGFLWWCQQGTAVQRRNYGIHDARSRSGVCNPSSSDLVPAKRGIT